jgi:hypothetical protein
MKVLNGLKRVFHSHKACVARLQKKYCSTWSNATSVTEFGISILHVTPGHAEGIQSYFLNFSYASLLLG